MVSRASGSTTRSFEMRSLAPSEMWLHSASWNSYLRGAQKEGGARVVRGEGCEGRGW